jgi:hypothetical protein
MMGGPIPDQTLIPFMAGVIKMGYFVAGFFFVRFWARTRDVLFLIFAGAFALLALNQALPVLMGVPREEQGSFYLLRAAGFGLIIIAILAKNVGGRAKP